DAARTAKVRLVQPLFDPIHRRRLRPDDRHGARRADAVRADAGAGHRHERRARGDADHGQPGVGLRPPRGGARRQRLFADLPRHDLRALRSDEPTDERGGDRHDDAHAGADAVPLLPAGRIGAAMRTHLSTAAIFVLATLVVAPRPARAVGELTGRIAGTVTAQEGGAPLAGADIIVTGPALVGGPRTLNANEDGSYEVVELPPGVYTVEAGYPGTVKAKRRVEVRQGQTSPLDLRWSAVMEEVKTYNIVEERHPTNPDSTETGAVLTKDQQSKVASGRRYQDLVQQVAGAVDVNGGGNYQIKGGNLTMNHYLVDGLDITDPVTNTFSANINFDSIASEQILTGGFEAEYNSLGGVINLITVAGGDKLSIDSSFYVNNQKFSVADQFGANNYDGVRPFGHLISPTTQSYGANLNIGGPIIRQHLWFNASFEYDYRETSIPMGPPLGVQHPPETSNRFLGRLKLTWAATPKNLVTLSASADPAFFNNVVQDN